MAKVLLEIAMLLVVLFLIRGPKPATYEMFLQRNGLIVFALISMLFTEYAWTTDKKPQKMFELPVIASKDVGWVTLEDPPVQVFGEDKNQLLHMYRVGFRLSDSGGTITALVSEPLATWIPGSKWKKGDEIFITRIPGRPPTFVVTNYREVKQ